MESTGNDLIEQHAHRWFTAITERHSRRSFTDAPVAEGLLDQLEMVCRSFRPFPGARVELLRAPSVDVFTGALGRYGKVSGAPHLLAMIATDTPAAHLAAGYTGQAAVLEATALGLGTCWVAGFFDPEKGAQLIELGDDERVVAVSPVGEPLADHTMTERLLHAMARSHSRKPLERIAEGVSDSWPSWAMAAVVAARLAPSAGNRQPWRFRLEESRLIVSKDTSPGYASISKEIDCGIAMLHARLGAAEAGATAEWELLDEGGLDLAVLQPA